MASEKTIERRRSVPPIRPRKAIQRGNLRFLPVSTGYTVYKEDAHGTWHRVGHSTKLPGPAKGRTGDGVLA